jgi:hypothetical protein
MLKKYRQKMQYKFNRHPTPYQFKTGGQITRFEGQPYPTGPTSWWSTRIRTIVRVILKIKIRT